MTNMSSGTYPLSADADAIRESIRRRGLTEVYHYAPLSQVPGIVQHGGIHPRAVLRERRIEFNDDPSRWSNDYGKAEALTDYVAVGVARPWGMMQHEPDCVVFGIRSDVLLRDGTAFMGAWSSRGEIRGLSDVEEHEGIASFNAMFDNATSNWPSELPGEILIKGTLRPQDITHLYVRSQTHLDRVRDGLRRSGVRNRPPYGPALRRGIFPPSMLNEE